MPLFPTFALALIDLDHFKLINDSHGHMAGDEVLRYVGICLRRNCRAYDVGCRFGGEEFALLFPDTEEPAASHIIERILAELRLLSIPVEDTHLSVSASAGLVTVSQGWHVVSASEILEVADGALYVAKGRGRDQLATVCLGVEDAPCMIKKLPAHPRSGS
jgi:diguanylate cyclase (GGDEF)-like protein